MIGAGLVAKKAVERGLETQSWVKSSLAPGSRVVTDYLEGSGLLPYLDRLRFNVVGYGCTTCIGNSGPLPDVIAGLIDEHSLVTAAVLSGNRNFEARVHPQVRANYLASPMLVVAFALAGRVDIDLSQEPLGTGRDGEPVYLRDIWPTAEEIHDGDGGSLKPELFERRYGVGVRGRRDLAGAEGAGGQPLCLGSGLDVRPGAPLLRRPAAGAAADARHQRRARARGAGRLGHHRSHLARRAPSPRTVPPPLPAGARRGAGGLEHLRVPPRQSRGHDAWHLRERAHQQRAGSRARRGTGPSTSPPARWCRSTMPPCATRPKEPRSWC